MRKLLFMLVLLTSVTSYAQNVAINNDASLPDNSAILDIKSGTKGLLIPRMNSAAIAAIVNPAKGLLVLDTAKNQLLVNMGTPATPNWQTIVASSGWSLTGNAGTDPNTQFIGTLDTKPFIIRVNNVRSGFIDTIATNTSYGFRSLDSITNGFANTAIGYKSLLSNKTGYENTGIGWSSLSRNSSGNQNTGNGRGSLFSNTTGSGNSAFGVDALYYNANGVNNTASGVYALYNNTIGSSNTASGIYALYYNSTGDNNIAIGQTTMLFNTTGSNNTAIGFSSLYNNQLGHSNVAIGTHALFNNVNRSNLVAIGDSALFNNTLGSSANYHGSENTAIGSKALLNNTTGYRNTAVGVKTLLNATIGRENTAHGWGVLMANTSGSLNTASGSNVMTYNTTGSSNVAYGWVALNNNTTGSDNTAIGTFTLNANVQGLRNTGLGSSANVGSANLSNATAIGANALVSCSNCMVLGSINGVNSAISNVNVGIGTSTPVKQFEVIGQASATPVTLVIGNRGGFGPAAMEFVSDYEGPGQWRPGYIRSNDVGGFTGSLEFFTNGAGFGNLYGNVKGFEVRNGAALTATGAVGSYSDARLKNRITAFTDGLNVINKINPVQFYYNADAPFKTDQRQVGVIAQDLEKFAPYMIGKNKQNGYDDLRSVNNQAYTFLLINAVKEQQQQIEKQQKEIDSSNEEVKQLKQRQKQFESSSQEVKQLQQQVTELKKLVEQLIKK